MEITMSSGEINVQTTQNRGHTTQELSRNAVNKIINIADTADPVIKQQAEAFKERMFYVIFHTLNQAVESNKTTLYNQLKQQGHDDMAEILRKL